MFASSDALTCTNNKYAVPILGHDIEALTGAEMSVLLNGHVDSRR